MDKFLKNINHEEVLKLADLVEASEGQVVSKTLAQNKYVSITVFAFSKGEEISTHESDGESLVMPARKPHSVHAIESFKMQLTVVFPLER